jgi:hypothetical protein
MSFPEQYRNELLKAIESIDLTKASNGSASRATPGGTYSFAAMAAAPPPLRTSHATS